MKLELKSNERDDSITDEAIRLYGLMCACECSCAPKKSYYEYTLCQGCESWWDLHGLLWSELKAKPWEWPVTKVPEILEKLEAAAGE